MRFYLTREKLPAINAFACGISGIGGGDANGP